MILISLVLLVLLGYMVNPKRRKSMNDYPKPFFKPAAPVYLCDSCQVPHQFSTCGPNRFVRCAHARDNVKLVGQCRHHVRA